MTSKLLCRLSASFAMVTIFGFPMSPAKADITSPNITERDELSEPVLPNSSFYGTGVGGRATEASDLRFEGERLCDDGKYEEAIAKLGRAVKLDPGDGATHVLYARAMSGRIKNQLRREGTVNEEDLKNTMREWKMLVWHDADLINQSEAKLELHNLNKVQKDLRKGIIAPEANRLASHFHTLQ